METTTAPAPVEGLIWHDGPDPINTFLRALYASHTAADGNETGGIIRVGSETSFDADGYSWSVSHDVFDWSGTAPTIEVAIDAATKRVLSAYPMLMKEGY